jgi:hypothetical protein
MQWCLTVAPTNQSSALLLLLLLMMTLSGVVSTTGMVATTEALLQAQAQVCHLLLWIADLQR